MPTSPRSTWRACRRPPTPSTAASGSTPAKNLLGIVGGILDGEIKRTEGDLDGAIAAFQKGAELQDGLIYDEPEPLPFAARHWLGAALLEAKRPAEAEKVYRDELMHHPHNGWSLYGLKLALAGAGQDRRRGRQGLREELGALRSLDSIVAVLGCTGGA